MEDMGATAGGQVFVGRRPARPYRAFAPRLSAVVQSLCKITFFTIG